MHPTQRSDSSQEGSVYPPPSALSGRSSIASSNGAPASPQPAVYRPSVRASLVPSSPSVTLAPVAWNAATGRSANADSTSNPTRRLRTSLRRVQLQANGSFVVEVPLSAPLISRLKYQTEGEFTELRYSALTCNPDEFSDQFQLKVALQKRTIKFAIVLTLHNEGPEIFCRSLFAIFKSINFLCRQGETDKSESMDWQSVLLCIITDGRKDLHPDINNVLGCMGLYLDGLTKSSVNGKPVIAHMFEAICQQVVASDLSLQSNQRDSDLVPVQTVLLMKEQSQKRLNSHRWFLSGICKSLKPETCMFLDTGVAPMPDAFLRLHRSLSANPRIGVCCGEIAVETSIQGCELLNPLVAAQNFEYKVTHLLDHPFESLMGCMVELPTSFSAFRYKALCESPMQAYLKGELDHDRIAFSAANRRLAGDRVLPFELVAQDGKQWVCKYIFSGKAKIRVPSSVHGVLQQRKAWVNRSFFASLRSVRRIVAIRRTKHSIQQKAVFLFQSMYNILRLTLSWFGIGIMYILFVFSFMMATSESDLSGNDSQAATTLDLYYPYGGVVFQVLRLVFLAALCAALVSSLGTKPQMTPMTFMSLWLAFALIWIFTVVNLGCVATQTMTTIIRTAPAALGSDVRFDGRLFAYAMQFSGFRDIIVPAALNLVAGLMAFLIALDPLPVFTSSLQYILWLPGYVNLISVFAFTNLHDVSMELRPEPSPTLGMDSVQSYSDPLSRKHTQLASTGVPDDLDEQYMHFNKLRQSQQKDLSARPAKQKTDHTTEQTDYFKMLRTQIILGWLVANGVLCWAFTGAPYVKSLNMYPHPEFGIQMNLFLVGLIWLWTGMNLLRCLGAMMYMIIGRR
ncbi:chitin synthase-domain-containing protein [Polychytrium aggregatum]|uniref:chitin synthase-domain-containing protein n=1 Tax=Polychytrium aggregatum TaxID=110093 RepID=UPI0022FE4BD4|nr:chitin synthase-domain-containing protein [Polychytrium aggregatum]KAI9204452.1 chitin synthase-domain-containing protein [Polychytrium aggregatum]